MRPRTIIVIVGSCLLLCCTDRVAGRPDVPEDPHALLVPAKKLRGDAVEEVKDGPWRVRRSGASSSTRSREEAKGDGASFAATSVPRPAEAPRPEPMSLDMEVAETAGVEGGVVGGVAGSVGDDLGPEGGHAGPALRAGETDDNEDFVEYLEFLEQWPHDGEQSAARIDVRDRAFVRVQTIDGRPVPGARVSMVDVEGDEVVWSGMTYGDGRIPVYPVVAGTAGRRLVIQVAKGPASKRLELASIEQDQTITLEGAGGADGAVHLDVMFLLDTTGSMGDEIARIKETLLNVTGRLRSLSQEIDLRYGAVLYRDLGDEYITRTHPFTSDIEAFDAALKSVEANGGGDGPESLNQGLAEAVGAVDWREDAAKVIFLIADAPPHMDYQGDVPYDQSLRAAVARGIRIHAVAASGLDPVGTLVFRQVAQYTRGKFIFIEYGTSSESAASHGVTGYVGSNNLDEILYDKIADEAAGWGHDRT